jgi:hypothetical protein
MADKPSQEASPKPPYPEQKQEHPERDRDIATPGFGGGSPPARPPGTLPG